MKIAIFVISFFLLFSFVPSVKAALVVIDVEGNVTSNVLASYDEISPEIPKKSSLEITKAPSDINRNSNVGITNENGKVMLSLAGEGGVKTFEVTKEQEQLIEFRQQVESEHVRIGVSGDVFTIEQRGIEVSTPFPISISPQEKELSVTTDSGIQFLSILPFEAVETVSRPRVITSINDDGVTLVNNPSGGLTYSIQGVHTIMPFNLVKYDVPVNAVVSASTGEIISVDEPLWFKVIGFMFS